MKSIIVFSDNRNRKPVRYQVADNIWNKVAKKPTVVVEGDAIFILEDETEIRLIPAGLLKWDLKSVEENSVVLCVRNGANPIKLGPAPEHPKAGSIQGKIKPLV